MCVSCPTPPSLSRDWPGSSPCAAGDISFHYVPGEPHPAGAPGVGRCGLLRSLGPSSEGASESRRPLPDPGILSSGFPSTFPPWPLATPASTLPLSPTERLRLSLLGCIQQDAWRLTGAQLTPGVDESGPAPAGKPEPAALPCTSGLCPRTLLPGAPPPRWPHSPCYSEQPLLTLLVAPVCTPHPCPQPRVSMVRIACPLSAISSPSGMLSPWPREVHSRCSKMETLMSLTSLSIYSKSCYVGDATGNGAPEMNVFLRRQAMRC